MARLIGTGKDPAGRYGDGEVFDVPKYAPVVGESDERELNPVYEELIDKGWAKAAKPDQDPAADPVRVAANVVAQNDPTDPVSARVAADLDVNDAYAKVHTGDPDATADDIGGGDLKPQRVKDAQRDDRRQVGPSPLGEEELPVEETEQRQETREQATEQRKSGDKSGKSGGK